ncbi:MAG: ATP-binding protein, partial [Bacteroidetes bacterium]
MIKRDITDIARKYSKYFSVLAIVGPRQSGKTTFVKNTFDKFDYRNLEEPDVLQFAENDARSFLEYRGKGLIVDEAQRVPQLFSYIQSIVDKNPKAKFILTGSQNFMLYEKITQSLAGRIGILKLLPFSQSELKVNSKTDIYELIFKGFYPPIHDKNIPPEVWLPNYIQTYIDRDVRQIKNITDYSLFSKFIRICAGRTGQIVNLSSISDDVGISVNTVKAWLSILETSFIITLLRPYHTNYNKRIIKAPKLYFFDTGLVASLLGIKNSQQLNEHYMKGALFENLLISELIKFYYNKAIEPPIYFWRDKLGREIDILVDTDNGILALEFKSASTANVSFSKNLEYWNNLSGNSPNNSYVFYGGEKSFSTKAAQFLPWFKLNGILNESW